jgi:predicted ester cyclase
MKDFQGDVVRINDCECVHETEKAIFVKIPGYGKDVSFPKSQIDESSDISETGDKGQLVVSQWIADQNLSKPLGGAIPRTMTPPVQVVADVTFNCPHCGKLLELRRR